MVSGGLQTKLTNVEHMLELTFGHAIAVEDNPLRFVLPLLLYIRAVVAVELNQLLRHNLEVIDHLLAGGLYATVCDVSRTVRINVANQRGEGRSTCSTGCGMDDIGAATELARIVLRVQEYTPHNDRRVMRVSKGRNRPCFRNGVDPSQFDVDPVDVSEERPTEGIIHSLQAHIGEVLRLGVDALRGLQTLRSHS